MPSLTYSGTFGGLNGNKEDGITATLTASNALPENAIIMNVTYSLEMSSKTYNTTKRWRMHWFAVGSDTGSPYAKKRTSNDSYTDLDYMIASNRQTLTGNMKYTQSDVSVFSKNTVVLYAKVYNTSTGTSFMNEVSITIEYELPNISVPTNLKVNGKTSDSRRYAVLTWTSSKMTGTTGGINYGYRVNGKASSDKIVLTGNTQTGTITYEIPEDVLLSYGEGVKITIQVYAVKPDLQNYTTEMSNSVTFTLRLDNTVSYHDGSKWVECVMHYHDGTKWVQVDPYYHDGNSWKLCNKT